MPRDPAERERHGRGAGALRRARRRLAARAPRCGSRAASRELAEVVRALDAEGIAIEQLQLHAPSLDDVFLAKTGRSLEGAEEAEEEAEDAAAEAVGPA